MKPEELSNKPLVYERALELGMWITHIVASQFYASNAAVYQRAAIDMEDLRGHLQYYILTARFLKTIEVKPGFYTEDQYRRSLYTSCKRACFAHFRKHVRSLKRGLALKTGATIPIHEMQTGDEDGVFAQIAGGMVEGEERFFDQVGNCLLDRVLIFLRYGGKLASLQKVAPTLIGSSVEQFIRNRITAHGT